MWLQLYSVIFDLKIEINFSDLDVFVWSRSVFLSWSSWFFSVQEGHEGRYFRASMDFAPTQGVSFILTALRPPTPHCPFCHRPRSSWNFSTCLTLSRKDALTRVVGDASLVARSPLLKRIILLAFPLTTSPFGFLCCVGLNSIGLGLWHVIQRGSVSCLMKSPKNEASRPKQERSSLSALPPSPFDVAAGAVAFLGTYRESSSKSFCLG